MEIKMSFPDIWQLFTKAKKLFLMTFVPIFEIDFKLDLEDWANLNKDEQHLIKCSLACFGVSHKIMNTRFLDKLKLEIKAKNAHDLFILEIGKEHTQSARDSSIIRTIISDKDEQNRLLNAIESMPSIRRKSNWMKNWNDNESATLGERLIVLSAAKRIFFSGSFAAIFWIKDRKLMPSVTLSLFSRLCNDRIQSDFSTLLFSYVINKPSRNRVVEIVTEAVIIEKKFMTVALPVNLDGLNCDEMSSYIEFEADQLLQQLGHDPHFNKPNPFDFMDKISFPEDDDLFEIKQENLFNVNYHDHTYR
jgi:ribonucleoside-diphosphate reductase subunit M2